MQDKIGLILPSFLADNRPKRGVILTSVLGGIASSVIGLAYEGISSFLHCKRQHALHKAVNVIEMKTDLQQNKIHHLEDTMIMYGAYNSNTLTDLIDTVHSMHNHSIWQEKMFIAKVHEWVGSYLNQEYNYAINSVLFLTTIREKYANMYEKFLEELKTYSKVIKILSKGHLPFHYYHYLNYRKF